MSRRLPLPVIAVAAGVVLAAVLLFLLAGAGGHASSSAVPSSEATTDSGYDGAVIPPSPPAPAFTLTDQYGRRVSLADYRGSVAVVTFLYSSCGATCIVIAQQIRGALNELPKPVPVLIVSADPAADTPASVRRFLAAMSLSGRVEYLTGSPSALGPVWRAYHVTPASSDPARFDRFASLWLLDARGRERVLFEPEVLTPESLAHDIRKLQAG